MMNFRSHEQDKSPLMFKCALYSDIAVELQSIVIITFQPCAYTQWVTV